MAARKNTAGNRLATRERVRRVAGNHEPVFGHAAPGAFAGRMSDPERAPGAWAGLILWDASGLAMRSPEGMVRHAKLEAFGVDPIACDEHGEPLDPGRVLVELPSGEILSATAPRGWCILWRNLDAWVARQNELRDAQRLTAAFYLRRLDRFASDPSSAEWRPFREDYARRLAAGWRESLAAVVNSPTFRLTFEDSNGNP